MFDFGGGYMRDFMDEINLFGDDSKDFAKSFFCPTEREIRHHREKINEIDNQISTAPTIDGFKVNIKNLDLSFLVDSE